MELPSRTIESNILVIGGATAALVAALEARRSVDGVTIVCKRKAGRSGNTIVSGAAFSAYVPGDDVCDSPEQHLADTLQGGNGINDPLLAQVLVSEAGRMVMGLEQYGVRFLRANGALVRRTPPGHSKPRSIPTDPAGCTHSTKGLSITLPLLRSAESRGVLVLSDMPVLRLLVRDRAVCGALALDIRTGEPVLLGAKAVILAAGGGGHIFSNTNNTADMTGDAHALALDAGVPLRDMEFVQFYPTMMSSPVHATVSSPLFGEGAVLRNRHGERFMPRYDPLNADMAMRDVMSRAIFSEVQAGNGVQGGVYMDCSAVSERVLEQKFPTLAHLLRKHSIDPAKQWLVVAPATHFLMGGAWIDTSCQTNVAGLFVAGEAAGGVHGANRLSGNALSEAVVFGSRAGQEAAAYVRAVSRIPEPSPAQLQIPAPHHGSLDLAEVKAEIRRVMWEHGSIVRTATGLQKAAARLQECVSSLPRCKVLTPADTATLLEVERMALVSQAIVAAALLREESRGAHYRDDFPLRDDLRWLGSTRVEKVGSSLQVTFVPLVTQRQS